MSITPAGDWRWFRVVLYGRNARWVFDTLAKNIEDAEHRTLREAKKAGWIEQHGLGRVEVSALVTPGDFRPMRTAAMKEMWRAMASVV